MIKIEESEKIKEYAAAMRFMEEKICDVYRSVTAEPPCSGEVVSSRLKTSESIEKKLVRKGYEVTIENAFGKLNDIAGVRCICPYVDELYEMAERLKADPDIRLVKEKDFIKKPKKSGYRSLHLIFEVPVKPYAGNSRARVEVQLRTPVMHLWARLEHKKIYKSEKRKNRRLQKMLEKCAELGGQMDQLMSEIHKKTGMTM